MDTYGYGQTIRNKANNALVSASEKDGGVGEMPGSVHRALSLNRRKLMETRKNIKKRHKRTCQGVIRAEVTQGEPIKDNLIAT